MAQRKSFTKLLGLIKTELKGPSLKAIHEISKFIMNL